MILPKPIKIVAVVLAGLGVAACTGFKRPGDYIPRRITTYLLRNSSPMGVDALPAAGTTYLPDWHRKLGIVSPADIALKGTRLYLLDATQPRLVIYDLLAEAVSQTYQLPATAYRVCPGNRYLLLADSARKCLYVPTGLGSAQPSYLTLPLAFAPTLLAFVGGKFYIAGTAPNQVNIFYEEALTTRDSAALPGTPFALEVTSQFAPVLRCKTPAGVQELAVDPLGDFLIAPQHSPYRKRRYTPFVRQLVGTELLQDVTLTGNRISLTALRDSVQDMEVDFRGSLVFALVHDSLITWDAAAQQRTAAFAYGPASWQKAVHHYHPE